MILAAALCALVSPVTLHAKSVKIINGGWSFRFPGTEEWKTVSLPHTYNSDAYSTRDYYRGKGEYRLNLRLPEKDASRRYFLKFDAANKAASVQVNGKHVMDHAGGYSAFSNDVTSLLRPGDNEVRVTVDNSRIDVPPLSADYTFWGGLYRDAWLIDTPLVHFDLCDNATSGVYATPQDVSEEKGRVKVKSRIVNDSPTAAEVVLNLTLRDGYGNECLTKSVKLRLKPGTTEIVETVTPYLENPKLWSPDSPSLYTLTASITDRKSGETIEETDVPVGFRWFSFEGKDGFKLNGKPLKLRGINRHQDLAPLGWALDDDAHRRDMRLLKDLGCNFVRLAHYQQDDAVLDECDRLGLIVWEEIPVVNMVPDAEGFDDNCETSLVEMVRQHYNHPSVMMWGYMNEILLKAPSDKSPEWEAARERILNLANRLERKLKEEDPTRSSVMAFHGSDRYNEVGLDVTDVQGWNLYQGWYGGDLTGFERYLEDQRNRYPERSLIVSEWGAGSDRRLHSSAPVPFDFSTEYQQKYIEHYLPYIEQNDYISGAAYWNFIDFNVAERQESMPRVNNKGLFYNDRTPKDVAYYFKSMWREDVPVVHIAVRDRDDIVAEAGAGTPVKVYSNCDDVELFVNGVSQGKRPVKNCNAVFDVILKPGISILTASGTRNGVAGTDAAKVNRLLIPDLNAGERLLINVGSNCDYTAPLSGVTWLADKEYTPGAWGYVGGKARSTTSEIFNTPDDPLFQTMREGIEEYRIDAPAGKYEVELLFTDINKAGDNSPYLLGRGSEGTDGRSDQGAMRMDVEINGELVDKDFAPGEMAGFQSAIRRRYVVTADSNGVVVRLVPESGKPLLSGIALRKL